MRLLVFILFFLVFRPLFGQDYVPFQLLGNLNTGTMPGVPVSVTAAGNTGYFFYVDYNATNGMQLWTTDGTVGGTKKAFEWGTPFFVENITPFGNSILFTNAGGELWISNGSAEGTFRLTFGAITMKNFFVIDDTQVVIFNMQTQSGYQLWRTDGSIPGTFRIFANNPPFGGSLGASVGSYYYYPGFSNNDLELWRTDGTTAELVKDINPTGSSSPHNFVAMDGKMYFLAIDPISNRTQVFSSDGTSGGTQRITSLSVSSNNSIQQLSAFNNEVYFLKADPGLDRSLYKSNGAPGNLTLVKSFDVTGALPFDFLATPTNLYFIYSTPSTGRELWATDGTTNGTRLVKDFMPGAADGIAGINGIRIIGNQLFFLLLTSSTTSELWKTDGVTSEIIMSESGAGQLYSLAAIGSKLLYSHSDTNLHGNIWTSSTSGVIQKLKEFPPIPGNTYAGPEGVPFAGYLYMTIPASDNSRNEMWRTNGDNVFEKVSNAPQNPWYFQVAGPRLYFLSDDGIHGQQVWYTDGTNMVMQTDFDLATEGEVPNQFFFVWGDRVFFYTMLAGQVTQWVTDATGNGMTALPPGPSAPFAIMDNKVYMSGVRDPQILQLWSTDGTYGGTQMIKEIDIVPSSSMGLSNGQVLNGKMLFSAGSRPLATSDQRYQLWVTDGTTGGTIKLREHGFAHAGFHCIPYKGLAYFGGIDEDSRFAIWRTDGTPQGTQKWFDPEPGTEFSYPLGFYIVDNNLTFFWQTLVDFGFTGDELWSTDGVSNPVRLKKFKRILNTRILPFGNKLIFNAEHEGDNTGEELWKTDGTEAGTQLVRDTEPGPTTGYISDLMDFGTHFYFRTTVQNQRRLWKSDGTTCQTLPMTDPADIIQQIFKYDNQRIILNVQTASTGREMFSYNRALEPVIPCRTIQSIQYASPIVEYSDQPVNFPISDFVTASSGLPVSVQLSNPDVVSISNGTLTTLKVGTVLVTLSQPGNSTFEPAPTVETRITVVKRQQVVQFGALANKSYGDPSFNLSATSNSSNAIAFTSSDPTVVSITGNVATILKPGNVTITANQAGDANNIAATPVPQSLVVTKATQTVTFTLIPAKTFGDGPFNLEASSNKVLPITFSSGDPNIVSLAGGTATIVKPGTVVLTANQPGNDFYLPASAQQSITVGKATQTVTFVSIPAKTFGDGPFNLEASSNKGLPITFSSSDINILSLSGGTATVVKPGAVILTASQAGDDYYLPASAQQSIVVGKATQTVSFTRPADKTYGDAAFNLHATSSSATPITFTTSDESIISISGSTATPVKPGSVTLTANQAGTEYYLSTSAEHTVTVSKASQSISFVVGSQQFSNSFVNLEAVASSALAVAYTSNNGHVSITGNKATFVSAGKASITATQSGNDYYLAAPGITREFCINPSKPSITLDPTSVPGPTLTSSASEGNVWYFNGTTMSATTRTIQATNEGSYAVEVSIEGCTSVKSDAINLTVTGVMESAGIYGFPNPVKDTYYLAGTGDASYRVVDTSGRMVLSGLVNSNRLINFSECTRGLYVVIVESKGESYRFKVMKE